MDRQEVRELHRRLNTVLHQFAVDNKVVYIPGSGRFDNSHVTFKVELHFPLASANASQPAPTGNADELNRAIYLRHAISCGCDPEWFGKTFTSRGRKFKVTGIRPNRPKNCVYVERQPDGKGFIFRPEDVRFLLGSRVIRPTPPPPPPTPPAKPFEKQPVAGGIWDLGKEREVA